MQGEQSILAKPHGIIFIAIFSFFMLIIFGVTVALTVFINKRIFMERLKYFKILIDENHITRKQYNTADKTIAINDVQEILVNSNQTLLIKGKEKLDLIGILKEIENFEILKNQLNEIKLLKKNNKPVAYYIFIRYSIVLLIFAAFASTFFFKNQYIVSTLSASLICFLFYDTYRVKKSKLFTKGTYIRSLIIISIASLVLLIRTIYVWVN